MAKIFDIYEAETQFHKLAKRVAAGEEVLIARNGQVIMKLLPFGTELSEPRDFNRLKDLTPNFTNQEWAALDKQFLDSIVFSKEAL